MSSHNLLRSLVNSAVRGKPAPAKVAAKPQTETVLDGASKEADAEAAAAAEKANASTDAQPEPDAALDDVAGPGGSYADTDIALKAVAAIHEWPEAVGEPGVGPADTLAMLFVGIADVDIDGELSDDESEIVDIAANAAWDYLSGLGASDDDLDALLNDWDNDVGTRVLELVTSKLPDGDEAAGLDMDAFVFGDGSDESAFDSATLDSVAMGAALDAVYRKKLVVRAGKKVRINKRVSGHVRLSAKQKLAVKKMLRRSHSAVATLRRRKSVRIRRQAGL